jgi:hypothetical protein
MKEFHDDEQVVELALTFGPSLLLSVCSWNGQR